MSELYIGLMSGTSADGINAALVDFSKPLPLIVGAHYIAYPTDLREKIHALCDRGEDEIKRMGELDVLLGQAFADATQALLKNQHLSAKHIQAIGCHGQTIRHYPNHPHPFTLQIGDPNIVAAKTGITTVADFRRKDVAIGGQGAPLVPAFHQQILASKDTHRAIVNIGGIANVTLLHAQQQNPLIAFDTGPGNVLMDSWIQHHQSIAYDKEGQWAAQGVVQPFLLQALLSDYYFKLTPPKSTGREHFNFRWLQEQLQTCSQTFSPVDIQATLAELTAITIVNAIHPYFSTGEILVCGGGSHNTYLMSRLSALTQTHFTVDSTQKYGVSPDWMEAMAFAWLARQTLHRKPGNIPSVTGAKQSVILGGIYLSEDVQL